VQIISSKNLLFFILSYIATSMNNTALSSDAVQMVTVVVHWEMYDGIPLMAKWVTISGLPEVRDKLEVFVSSVEYLAVNWQWAPAGYGWLDIENDVPHTTVHWSVDSVGQLPGGFQVSLYWFLPHDAKQSAVMPQ